MNIGKPKVPFKAPKSWPTETGSAASLLGSDRSVMPLQSTIGHHGKGLCLLSLDAGGARGVSQLKILAELKHRLNFEAVEDQKLLPCDVFDMIGGSGSGGFIAILFVVLGLNMEQAMEEFIELSVNILEKRGLDAPARTTALKAHVETLLEKYGISKEMRLLDLNERSKGCKLVVPISYKDNFGPGYTLRNFDVRQEAAPNSTIAEAILATLASPPLFTSTSIFKDYSTFEYVSANLTLSNPTRQIVAEAYGTFGEETRIACLLNIGCGHPGLNKSPEGSHITAWIQFLEKLVADSEQKAEQIKSSMGHLGIYHRFSVTRGLEEEKDIPEPRPGDAIMHTAVYLTGFDVSKKMEMCVDSLRLRDGVALLGQLQQSGGQSVPPAVLPPLTKHFVMRKKPCDFIEKAMLESKDDSDADEARMLVVTGMGGCGKTQLMLKFVHVHKDKFAAAFFIDGSSVPRIRADTIRHVRSLGVAHSQKGFEDCVLFLSQPCVGKPRLVLYDNVDDPDIDLAPLLPLGGSCAIVITSRNRSLGELSPEAHLELDTMELEEAVDLLLQRSGRSTVITDHMREEAGAIARALGFLPIALTQARSYMYQTQCSPGQYLARLLDKRDKLLSQPVKHHPDMRYLSTYAAFDASFGLLSTPCQQLLRLLSFVHWSDFPLELVILASRHDFSDYRTRYIGQGDDFHTGRAMLKTIFLHEGQWDITNFDGMIVSLRNHSLITLTPGVGTQLVQIHPIAHGWVKSCIPEHSKAMYQAGAILLLSLGSHSYYTPCAQYLTSHITYVSCYWDGLHINTAEAFAHVLYVGGSFEGALKLRERVVNDLRRQVEPNVIDIANSTWSLALSYLSAGRYKDAELLQLESLRLYKDKLGERHPDTIMISSNLALTYRAQGQLKEAEALQEEALKLRKEILGDGHPDTLLSASDLAATYRFLARMEDAQRLVDEVLKIRKTVLGDRHPDTITSLTSLALIYRGLGRLKEAESLQKEVLRHRREILGRHHPDTITTMANLAIMYCDMANLKEAELLLQEVLGLMKELLGDHHPGTIMASSDLALTYRSLGRLKEAESLQKEVLRLRKEMMGERHPDTITASSNLALTYNSLGRLKEAELLQVEVLGLRERILGHRHPNTITAAGNLATTYRHQGQLKKAETIQKNALRLTKEILGNRHPDTITASGNLALTYRDLGQLKKAVTIQEEVVKLRKEILGECHLDTLASSNFLAEMYLTLRRIPEAEILQVETLRQAQEILGGKHPLATRSMLTMAEIYESLSKKIDALTLVDTVEPIIAENCGEDSYQYRRCHQIRIRLQAGPDDRITGTALTPVTARRAMNSIPSAQTIGRPSGVVRND